LNRKELKNRGLAVLQKHYWLLVVILAFGSFLGVENPSSYNTLKSALTKESSVFSEEMSTSILDERFGGFTDIVKYISGGFGSDSVWKSTEKLQESGKNFQDSITDPEKDIAITDTVTGIKDGLIGVKDTVAEEAYKTNDEQETTYFGPIEVGLTQGVFASVASTVSSGNLFKTIFTGIATIFRSDDVAAIIFIILILLVSIFVWSFITRVYVVIIRRFLLEARTYESVPVRRIFFLTKSGRWFHTSWVLFTTSFITTLWYLTLIGGIIKSYQYMMVPYILAENPSVSPREARALSTAMMNGHKWEAFKLKFSFIGWHFLSTLLFGIPELVFVNAYEATVFAEYYSELRLLVKKRKKKIPEAELLNDRFLYIHADDEHINEAYADILELAEEKEIPMPNKLKGVSGFIARNFGVVLFANKEEAKLCEYEEHQQKIKTRQDVFEKKIYPFRLFPAYRKTILNLIKPPKIEYLHYGRRYSIWSIVLMFFLFSFMGWLWEIALHLYEDGVFVNRGFLNGPYVPIYGFGGTIILVILYRLRNKPLLEFLSTIVLCGVLEYVTATVLYNLYNAQWWDYTGYFLNIQGRICAEGLLIFGVFGAMVVYLLGPVCDNIFRRIRLRVAAPICIVLLLVFMGDIIYSSVNPNTGVGITEYPEQHQEEQK